MPGVLGDEGDLLTMAYHGDECCPRRGFIGA